MHAVAAGTEVRMIELLAHTLQAEKPNGMARSMRSASSSKRS
jgi:hypothetical protein